MNTIKFEKLDTKVIAHRGLSGIEKENTNSAFVAAGNRSYYGIETDIHRTGDGNFVVNHDMDLKRVSGENVPVEEISLAVLQNIILFDVDGSKNRNDLRPGTLENYVGICKKYEKKCVLELKSQFFDEEVVRMLDVIRGLDYLDSVTFISIHYDNLLKIRNIVPKQSVQFLCSEITEDIINRVVDDGMDIDVRYDRLTKNIIDRFHVSGVRVNCWTVDTKETAEQLAEWGVDYITSNILE